MKMHDTDAFFRAIGKYTDLSAEACSAWASLLRPRKYRKEEAFIRAGDVPTVYAFVVEALFYQHYIGPDGNMFIKYFFPENRITASVSATILGPPSLFAITAIEDSTVLEYDFAAFKGLVRQFPDVAAFYISYLERHWVVEKEPMEIALRHDEAMQRYLDFLRSQPELHKRLKQHHIAAWLGVTPGKPQPPAQNDRCWSPTLTQFLTKHQFASAGLPLERKARKSPRRWSEPPEL